MGDYKQFSFICKAVGIQVLTEQIIIKKDGS